MVPSLIGKSSGIIRGLSVGIMSGNYDLVYQSHRKVEIYRDTGVSKNSFVINSNYQSLYRPNKGDLDSLIKLRLGLWSL